MGTYQIRLSVKMNGVRDTIMCTSDQILGEVLEANNIPYEGITATVSGKKLQPADYQLTMGELGFPEDAYLLSVKNMDCAA